MNSNVQAATDSYNSEQQDLTVIFCRCFAWISVAAITVFLLENYLTHWRNWPGAMSALKGDYGDNSAFLAFTQAGFYLIGALLAIYYVVSTKTRLLRPDTVVIYGVSNYIIRAAFWAVLLVGIADMVVSFLRVEGFLEYFIGAELTSEFNRPRARALYLHLPIFFLGLFIALIHRGLAFHWLALAVVSAELLIVLSRFIFSYEQAFMGDLVRFWYAALFLFASAYTLYEEGHVRVDVLYSTFSTRTKGFVNAIGCVILGMALCWIIVILGMGSKSTIINSPILNFEVTQTGFGMFVKYWMAGFLGVFAVSMLLHFIAYFLESIADFRDEPNKRVVLSEGADH